MAGPTLTAHLAADIVARLGYAPASSEESAAAVVAAATATTKAAEAEEAAYQAALASPLSSRPELPDALYGLDEDENQWLRFSFDEYYYPPISNAIAAVDQRVTDLRITIRPELPDGVYYVDDTPAENLIYFKSADGTANDYPAVASSGSDASSDTVASLGLRARMNYGWATGESKAQNVSTGHTVFSDLFLAEDGATLASLDQEIYSGYLNHSGYNVAELMGSSLVAADQAHIDTQVAAALAAGKSFAVEHIGLMLGTNDYLDGTPAATFKTQTYAYVDNREAYILQVTGVQEPPVWVLPLDCTFLYQGRTNPYLIGAMLEMAEERDNVVISCATYQFEYSDGTHMTTESARILSAYNFLAAKRYTIDGIKYHPTAYTEGSGFVQNAILSGSSDKQSIWVGHFTAPVLPLAFDTTIVTNFADSAYGFKAFDGNGDALTITDVRIVGRDQVQVTTVTAAADSSDGQIARLDYAKHADPGATGADLSGFDTGARGNLCDSTTTSFTPSGGSARTLKSFCIPFTFSIA